MTSLTRCHERLDELGNTMASTNTHLASVEQKQAEIHPLNDAVSHFQKNLNMMAQKQLSNELEIIGIPENKNENLTYTVLVASRKIRIDLADLDIDWVAHVGPQRAF
ncbi:unnamed protein product [Parnassius apollo]|uniref:(apollo) hypothetical protein n=1 Tax=Parnassius apollo TaxID=110799 RepID=A0A8S3WRJ2_PARAO|nr:unnamed protein product [Parnassius apollo]